jgi:hypothetical protein
MLDPAGLESTDDPEMDIEAAVRIVDMEDKNLNHDIEVKVLHSQGLKKYQNQLKIWQKAHRIEYRPRDLW